ncbi:MAG: O-methyltransferase, partial [Calditrichaeota bacterium]
FDIVFNDIEKERYPEALEVISPRLRTGGVLITDNMFWHGRVLEREPDAQTQGILKYTASLFQSPEWVSTIVPLRDGVAISLKM